MPASTYGRRFTRHENVQLAAGARAAPGLVGYIGLLSDLTTINPNDSVPGGWNATWDTNNLIVSANNVVIDHYKINAPVIFEGTNPTITNCIVTASQNDLFVITHQGFNKGFLTVTDCTTIGNYNHTTFAQQVDGISSDSGLIARRCDVYGTGDGIHPVPQPGSYATGSIVSQCYVHDQAFVDESQHCDGMQWFSHQSSTGFLTVEHCYIAKTVSTIGTPLNSALTCMPNSDTISPLCVVKIDNNFFASGLYHLRMGNRASNCVVTNNDFGPLDTAGGEFGLYDYVNTADIITWSNNRDYLGNQISFP